MLTGWWHRGIEALASIGPQLPWTLDLIHLAFLQNGFRIAMQSVCEHVHIFVLQVTIVKHWMLSITSRFCEAGGRRRVCKHKTWLGTILDIIITEQSHETVSPVCIYLKRAEREVRQLILVEMKERI